MGAGTGCPITTARTSTGRPAITRSAANTMQPPACEVYPDLIPTTPLEPISVTRLGRVPTRGSVTDDLATTSANVGIAMAAAATFRQSTAEDTECWSKPLAST